MASLCQTAGNRCSCARANTSLSSDLIIGVSPATVRNTSKLTDVAEAAELPVQAPGMHSAPTTEPLAAVTRARAPSPFAFEPKSNSTPDAIVGNRVVRQPSSLGFEKGINAARSLFANAAKRPPDRRYTAHDIIVRLDAMASQLRRIEGRMAYVEEYATRANRVETYVLDQSAQNFGDTQDQARTSAPNAALTATEAQGPIEPNAQALEIGGAKTIQNVVGPIAAEIEVLAMNCNKRHVFAAKLASRMFTAAERVDRNCSGIGKAALSPTRLLKIRELSFAHPRFALQPGEVEAACWKDCVKAIDSRTRVMRKSGHTQTL